MATARSRSSAPAAARSAAPTPTIPAACRDTAAPGSEQVPVVLEPATPDARGARALEASIAADPDGFRALVETRGAVVLRGFSVQSAMDFERVVRAFDPALASSYLGTSPRLRLTDHVFTASELAWFYPIPQHCEMSFLPSAPARIYFHGMVPAKQWGETPLVDFEAVARDLDDSVRERFASKGIRNIRNYVGPEGGAASITQLKPWHEMFGTRDRDEVDAIAAREGLKTKWKSGGRLALINEQPAFRTHPTTGRQVWYNHTLVFHHTAGPQETRLLAETLGKPLFWGLHAFAQGITWRDRNRQAAEDRGTECTFGDGSPISDEDMMHVRRLVWKHQWAQPWQRYDVVLLDNRRVSHGRRPFKGDRVVTVAWSEEIAYAWT